MLQGIASQVGHHLCESIRIPFAASITLQLSNHPPVWECQSQFVDDLLGDFMKIDVPWLDGNAGGGA